MHIAICIANCFGFMCRCVSDAINITSIARDKYLLELLMEANATNMPAINIGSLRNIKEGIGNDLKKSGKIKNRMMDNAEVSNNVDFIPNLAAMIIIKGNNK